MFYNNVCQNGITVVTAQRIKFSIKDFFIFCVVYSKINLKPLNRNK